MTSGARGNPIQVPRSSLEAAGARELWAEDVTYSDLGLAARDQPQGLPPYSQPWALDLLEWAVALPLEPWEALATGLPPPGMVMGVG